MSHLKLNKLIFLFILSLGFACSNSDPEKSSDQQKGRIITLESELTFIDTEGNEIRTLQIAVADEQMERNQGLMDVREMGQDEGMLFIFENNQPLSFWMANTPLSLDIMYVGADSTIVRIYSDTTPFSETSLPSGDPAMYVVETNAGYAFQHGISEGMKIRF
jgi:uncharacterized membrane protein (UPF0127 family)